MKVKVKIPMALRKITGGQGEVEAEGTNIETLINNLENQYSGLKAALCDNEGKIRGYVNIYINDEDFRSIDELNSQLKDGDEIAIIPAIAGG